MTQLKWFFSLVSCLPGSHQQCGIQVQSWASCRMDSFKTSSIKLISTRQKSKVSIKVDMMFGEGFCVLFINDVMAWTGRWNFKNFNLWRHQSWSQWINWCLNYKTSFMNTPQKRLDQYQVTFSETDLINFPRINAYRKLPHVKQNHRPDATRHFTPHNSRDVSYHRHLFTLWLWPLMFSSKKRTRHS